MKLRRGVLVACDFYGLKRDDEHLRPPTEKRAIGLIRESNGHHEGTESFRVLLIHPKNVRGQTLGFLASDLMPLAQTEEGQSNLVEENLPDIILAMARHIARLEKRTDDLERRMKFLAEANMAL